MKNYLMSFSSLTPFQLGAQAKKECRSIRISAADSSNFLLARAMADENARRTVEQEKLNTWCSRVGIESASDLAFWFTSYDQALQEAGRAVADGWDLARRESEPGMAALVRNLFARETVRQSRPPQPSSTAATSLPSSSVARPKPSSFAGPVRPKKLPARPSGEKGGVTSLFIRDLLGIMVTLMPPPPARHDEYMANWHSRLEKICARTEAATIKRVVHTWKDLVRYMDHLGLTFPDSHALATFIREHHGPTRVFTSLGWMIRNLRVPLDLGESSKPAPIRSTRLGQGQIPGGTS